uniref:Uncharacterized protein n=1 Tax=Aegilops tauschii subsp. strangulata TaxID=200361 RepID=A0A453AL10_AEGTS
ALRVDRMLLSFAQPRLLPRLPSPATATATTARPRAPRRALSSAAKTAAAGRLRAVVSERAVEGM